MLRRIKLFVMFEYNQFINESCSYLSPPVIEEPKEPVDPAVRAKENWLRLYNKVLDQIREVRRLLQLWFKALVLAVYNSHNQVPECLVFQLRLRQTRLRRSRRTLSICKSCVLLMHTGSIHAESVSVLLLFARLPKAA